MFWAAPSPSQPALQVTGPVPPPTKPTNPWVKQRSNMPPATDPQSHAPYFKVPHAQVHGRKRAPRQVPRQPCLQPYQLGVHLASSQALYLNWGLNAHIIATDQNSPQPGWMGTDAEHALTRTAKCSLLLAESAERVSSGPPSSRQAVILPQHSRPMRRPRPQHAVHASAGGTCPNPPPLAAAADGAHSPRSLLHGPATCRFRCGCQCR